MSITIQLPQFEGPLGLLLYLIRKDEMDIMNINIFDITKQYFEYIKLMKELDLEVAGDFVAMASTLIQIKSKMLLPQYGDNGEILEQEDPRKELVQKLIEYQKYQEAAKLLYDRPLVGRDVWIRGSRETLQSDQEEEIILEENALFSLISSYRKAIKAMKKKIHKVTSKAQSIASRVLELKDLLVMGKRTTLWDLITATENRARQTLITFLSLLELGKLGFVGLYQADPESDMWIDLKKPIESDVLSRVEDYEGLKPQENHGPAALKLLEEDLQAETTLAEAPKVSLIEGEENILLFSDEVPENEIDLHLEMASDEEILAAEKELFAQTEANDESNESAQSIGAFNKTEGEISG